MCSATSAGIDFVLRRDEELAAVLEVIDGVGKGRAAFEGDHRAVAATRNVALIGLIFLETVRHDGFALRGGEHIGAQTDDAARGDVEFDVDALAHVVH